MRLFVALIFGIKLIIQGDANMKFERLLGNFGTIRTGAFAGFQFYWNRQWSLHYKAVSGKHIKTVKVDISDLQSFYIKGKCENGIMTLKMSQGNVSKDIELWRTFDKRLDMTGFQAGLLKLDVAAKSAKNVNVKIGWRKTK